MRSDLIPPADLWPKVKHVLTPRRTAKMEERVSARNTWLRLVLQDIHDPHNIHACLRSADAFGLYEVDTVTLGTKLKMGHASRGAHHWLKLYKHKSVEQCVHNLRSKGYRIYAGLPRKDSVPIHDLKIDEPLAVVFGNEQKGIDPSWYPHLDGTFTIPMYGMVESLNISVAAAITLQELNHRIRQHIPESMRTLDPQQKEELLSLWISRQINHWPLVLERLNGSLQPSSPSLLRDPLDPSGHDCMR